MPFAAVIWRSAASKVRRPAVTLNQVPIVQGRVTPPAEEEDPRGGVGRAGLVLQESIEVLEREAGLPGQAEHGKYNQRPSRCEPPGLLQPIRAKGLGQL